MLCCLKDEAPKIMGHSTTTWIQFYPILTPPTPLEWTEMDILHSINPLSRGPLWTFCWPSTPSSCPRSYWMPPYKLQHSLTCYYTIPSSFIKILFQILLQVCGHYSKNNLAKKAKKKILCVCSIKVYFQLILASWARYDFLSTDHLEKYSIKAPKWAH